MLQKDYDDADHEEALLLNMQQSMVRKRRGDKTQEQQIYRTRINSEEDVLTIPNKSTNQEIKSKDNSSSILKDSRNDSPEKKEEADD